jgi:quercetin dioxygenase-like cupin family protein
MYINNYHDIPPESTEVDGLNMRWVISPSDGAMNYSMRLLELESLKSTPMHQHDSEHEIFVLVGLGNIETETEVFPIRKGSVIYVSPNEAHRFVNTGASLLRFIDVVTVPERMKK